jgi:aspartate-semialdehyde dehydrogenase
MNRIRVGILGATGTVGQRFTQLLEHHPIFDITAVAASERSVGKPYGKTCSWKLTGSIPESIRELAVQPIEPSLDCDIVFSSLPSDIAREAEETFARAGYPVISNSSSFRMDPDVPLLIPEVNGDHIGLIDRQRELSGYGKGFIVTNPNCAVVAFAPPLAAIHAAFGVSVVSVTTLQAISGAGYPGVPSLDITDNVFPFISGEEPKVETEAQKILCSFNGTEILKADFTVSAHCFRVNVVDGHMASVRVKLKSEAKLDEIVEVVKSYPSLDLHSSLVPFLQVTDDHVRPQPRLDRDNGKGLAITVGRVAKQLRTTWFRVSVWDKHAENAAKFLKKGSLAYVEGRLRVDEWTDRENVNRYSLEVHATDVQFLSGGRTDDRGIES